jgi:hypothetical protein
MSGEAPSSPTSRRGGGATSMAARGPSGTSALGRCTSSATTGWAVALQVQATGAGAGGKGGFLAEFRDLSAYRVLAGTRHRFCMMRGRTHATRELPDRDRPEVG